MQELYHKEIGNHFSHKDGMVTIDGCDFPKEGNKTAGAMRQYCGHRGKVSPSQASIIIGYLSYLGSCFVDSELYLPQKWFDESYFSSCKKCGIPNDI
jgi:SRSO17 transposase